MIIHLFNSSSVSGPEKLVLPALSRTPGAWLIVNLVEERKMKAVDALEQFARELSLPYLAVRVRSRWDRQAIADLGKVIDEKHPEAVHAHDVKASIYLLSATKSSRPFPIFSTHHGVHGRPDWKTRLYEWLYRRRFLKDFSRVLCVSTSDFEFMVSTGLSRDKLRLHLNGVAGMLISDASRPAEAKRIRKQWLPQTSNRDDLFLFGMVGRLSKEKGHDRLLRVLADLAKLPDSIDWKCLIFGEGALAQPLHEQTSALGLDGHVSWMGYRKTISTETAGFDVLLSFSSSEGLPINLLEAGWAGTPVAATAVGGVNDLIPDESYGVRIAPREPEQTTATRLGEFFRTDGRLTLRKQAERYQAHVKDHFSEKCWVDRLMSIYGELGISAPSRGDLKDRSTTVCG